jgi:hypothetical protein
MWRSFVDHDVIRSAGKESHAVLKQCAQFREPESEHARGAFGELRVDLDAFNLRERCDETDGVLQA